MNGSETSGVDLARVALRAAMAQARQNGGGQKAAKPRPVRTVRRDGREPMGLGAAIDALVTERAWELPTAGATLRERWAAIAPELAGHVAAVSYDADSGRLTVCPESSAWATKARLEQTRIVAAANSRRTGRWRGRPLQNDAKSARDGYAARWRELPRRAPDQEWLSAAQHMALFVAAQGGYA